MLAGVWNQFHRNEVARDGLLLEVVGDAAKPGAKLTMPVLPDLHDRGGFAIDFWVKLDELTAGQTILDARDAKGKGLALSTSERSTIALVLNDGQQTATWDSDPGTHPGTLKSGVWQHVAVIVDAGPRLILFAVDGVLNDGGALRQYGWGRFGPEIGDVNGSREATLAPKLFGEIAALRIYGRPLRTSEAVGNWRAGRP